MEGIINRIFEYLLPQNDIFLYIFLFISAIVENLFPPIPGDTITAFGAFLVGTGRLDYFLVYIATSLGSVIGFMALFFLGRLMEREYFIRKNYRFFPAVNIIAAEKWFSRYGYFVVLANRFLPGIRSVISVVSGITKLNVLRVFLLALVSASVWNLIWIHVGFMLGNNWAIVKERIGDILQKYNIIVGVILGIALAAFVTYRILKRKKESNISR